jgi:hypothetical protein
MSRTFTDNDLLTWEAYASGGDFGMPADPKIIFNCLSKPGSRARYVVHRGDQARAEEVVHEASPDQLRALLQETRALD